MEFWVKGLSMGLLLSTPFLNSKCPITIARGMYVMKKNATKVLSLLKYLERKGM